MYGPGEGHRLLLEVRKAMEEEKNPKGAYPENDMIRHVLVGRWMSFRSLTSSRAGMKKLPSMLKTSQDEQVFKDHSQSVMIIKILHEQYDIL